MALISFKIVACGHTSYISRLFKEPNSRFPKVKLACLSPPNRQEASGKRPRSSENETLLFKTTNVAWARLK